MFTGPRQDRIHVRRRGVPRAVAPLLLLFGAALLAIYSPSPTRVATATGVARRVHTTPVVDTQIPSTGCGHAPPVAPGEGAEATLSSGGRTRSYRLHVPLGYNAAHPYPLVLNFHGHGSTAAHQEVYTGFSRLADRAGFIVTYPQGVVGPDGHTGWASGGPNKPHGNDVLFVSDLVTKLQGLLCVDPTRIYATGFSNGGGMTSLLACRLAGRIAAFATVSGSYFAPSGGCDPERPAPILEIHGTGDHTVPYGGSTSISLIGAMAWARSWAARDHCAAAPSQFYAHGGVTGVRWSACQGNATVIHYRIANGAHVWPGSPFIGHAPPGDAALDATGVIWNFFVAHALAEPPTATRTA